ncbi:2-aminoethylphosphonate--pyruvate transaminase [Serratia marcescens]|uniref:2-aminoethylphosphonate--pyruvate transaminase n=2 Tax=Serratia marcescens TaxID=615 RepID=UPI000F7F663A|nr:2-aminoethylphosphonate--pyruvate transaminase [Serratia marcescens]RTF83738.1 2-aminoethylphosphonate--pyruvate transaminase [Serratia marcescens]
MSDRNYLLLTPGPLTTSKTVKEAMLYDSCTWDEDYNLGVVQRIRQRLVALATPSAGYTSVLLQGSGSFAVEGVLGTVIGPHDKLLIVNNGAYGARMIEMARLMDIDHHAFDCGEVNEPDVAAMEAVLKSDARISHIAMVHCETTTGMLNPLQKVAGLAARNGKTFIVDAMSSFGGIPLDVDALGIDFLISSANKCIQGVPGFAFVIARRSELEKFLLHLAEVAPFQDDRLQEIVEWDQVKLLSIRIDRLDRWAKPGVLCIGDAAHAMSPIGGVGVNLAIQDAVAAANALIPPLRQHRLQLKHLLSVQRRREFPTRAIQFLQIKMSQRKPGQRRAAGGSRLIARVGNSRWLPRLFGRIIGLGFRRETPRHLSNETCPPE